MNIISKTKNGKVFECDKCNRIHIEFLNLNFNFTSSQYRVFVQYMARLDGERWQNENAGSELKRKIVIPTDSQSLNILLNIRELDELKMLLKVNRKNAVESLVIPAELKREWSLN